MSSFRRSAPQFSVAEIIGRETGCTRRLAFAGFYYYRLPSEGGLDQSYTAIFLPTVLACLALCKGRSPDICQFSSEVPRCAKGAPD
eukprot:5514779-Heterocapsa_arctica.AAC.1